MKTMKPKKIIRKVFNGTFSFISIEELNELVDANHYQADIKKEQINLEEEVRETVKRKAMPLLIAELQATFRNTKY